MSDKIISRAACLVAARKEERRTRGNKTNRRAIVAGARKRINVAAAAEG